MILLNCTICSKKESKFIKNQEASELLGQSGIRIPSRNICMFEKSSLKWMNCWQTFVGWRQSYARTTFKTTKIYI